MVSKTIRDLVKIKGGVSDNSVDEVLDYAKNFIDTVDDTVNNIELAVTMGRMLDEFDINDIMKFEHKGFKMIPRGNGRDGNFSVILRRN